MIAFTWLSPEQQFQPFAEWLGTFALHSTVALGLTFALVRLRGQRSLGLQDMLLRQAMWLPLFSATLQYLCFGSVWQSLLAEPAVTVDELVPLAGGGAPSSPDRKGWGWEWLSHMHAVTRVNGNKEAVGRHIE